MLNGKKYTRLDLAKVLNLPEDQKELLINEELKETFDNFINDDNVNESE